MMIETKGINTMKRTTAMRKLYDAIQAVTEQKRALTFTEADREIYKSLHEAEKILDRALWALLRG